MWFFFGIPAVIGDLNGRTARKSIARMRAANEKTGVKTYKESKTNFERGKLTKTIRGSESDQKSKNCLMEDKPETGLLEENSAERFESEATGILIDDSTDILHDENSTVLLSSEVSAQSKTAVSKKINLIEEIIIVHTEEMIG